MRYANIALEVSAVVVVVVAGGAVALSAPPCQLTRSIKVAPRERRLTVCGCCGLKPAGRSLVKMLGKFSHNKGGRPSG